MTIPLGSPGIAGTMRHLLYVTHFCAPLQQARFFFQVPATIAPTYDRPPCHVSAQVVIPVGLDFGYCQADDVSERVIFVRNTGEVSTRFIVTGVYGQPLDTWARMRQSSGALTQEQPMNRYKYYGLYCVRSTSSILHENTLNNPTALVTHCDCHTVPISTTILDLSCTP